jgi:hypothetical protein
MRFSVFYFGEKKGVAQAFQPVPAQAKPAATKIAL